MDAASLKRISKQLSYVLRHRPDSVGIELEPGGWVAVDVLMDALARNGRPCSREVVEQVVAENDKQRFEFSEDGNHIRARQGHSVEIELGYASATPPDVLYHGTATRNVESILELGLVKGRRHHVHMSTNRETMLAVGRRHGTPVMVTIDARQMHEDGHEFFVTGNDVWLTDHVPPNYLRVVD